jgi:hypothetical protein
VINNEVDPSITAPDDRESRANRENPSGLRLTFLAADDTLVCVDDLCLPADEREAPPSVTAPSGPTPSGPAPTGPAPSPDAGQ